MSSRRALVLVFRRGNIKDASNKRNMQKYLNKCEYHEEKEPYCPNFRLGYIAHKAKENFTELCRTVSIRSTLQRVLMFQFNVEQDSYSYSSFHGSRQTELPLLPPLSVFFCQGGVIGVFINWQCNLDIDPSNCKPTYAFRRLDLRKDQANSGYYYR